MKGNGRLFTIGIIFLGLILMPIPYSAAQSANNPPVAEEDAYLTYLNTDLIVTAPGVLANDSDQDSDPMTAILEDDDLENGTLVQFNSDGSFTYRPDPGFSGVDTFTYRVLILKEVMNLEYTLQLVPVPLQAILLMNLMKQLQV